MWNKLHLCCVHGRIPSYYAVDFESNLRVGNKQLELWGQKFFSVKGP